MSASLVGSEMCIRDSQCAMHGRLEQCAHALLALGRVVDTDARLWEGLHRCQHAVDLGEVQ
eukprot:11505119-Alexandrium_andersonii.AAC.1